MPYYDAHDCWGRSPWTDAWSLVYVYDSTERLLEYRSRDDLTRPLQVVTLHRWRLPGFDVFLCDSDAPAWGALALGMQAVTFLRFAIRHARSV